MDNKYFLVIVLALGAGGYFMFFRAPSEAADISEADAKMIAETQLREYCKMEGSACSEFAFKGTQPPPTDKRFFWAFHYMAQWTTPRKQMIVLVGKKGDFTITGGDTPPPPEDGAVAPAPPEGAAAPPGGAAPAPPAGEGTPAAPAEAPPAPPAEAAPSQ